jgi:hypothetical protein
VTRLHLTVNKSTFADTTATICKSSFTWYGNTYTTSGNYKRIVSNAQGCNYTKTLHLSLNSSTTSDTTAAVCNSYKWYGTVYSISGNYVHIRPNKKGCDSVMTMHLTVNKGTAGDTTAVVCTSITWYGKVYTASGNVTKVLKNKKGCDSTLTLHLTVNKTSKSDTTAAVCGSFTWYGKTYTSTGNYTRVIKNAKGCDSTITLHLTSTGLNLGISVNKNRLSSNTNYGIYQWIDCNNANASIKGEIKQSYTPGKTGDYAVIVTLGKCTDTSACQYIKISPIGIDTYRESADISIYPNPSTGLFTVSADKQITSIKVFNAIGEVVFQSKENDTKMLVNISNQMSGLYLLEVITNEGTAVRRIVKQ